MSVGEPLPLFPLHAVLFPGGSLELRVFEPRYLDMIRECGRSGSGFGICLIAQGNEAGAPAVPVDCGTEAVIEDFDTGADGLLHLRVRGVRRFRVRGMQVRDNGLVQAEVEWCRDDPRISVQPQHALLVDILRAMLERASADVDVPEAHYDDAAWLGWMLASLLPLTLQQRQAILAEDDPDRRLDALLQGIPGMDGS